MLNNPPKTGADILALQAKTGEAIRVISDNERAAILELALRALTRDSMANDFNEHWDSYKAAELAIEKAGCARCHGNGVIGWTTGQTPESFDQGEAPCPDCLPVVAAGQCCQVTPEEQALMDAGDYRAEELFGVGGKPSCPKCVKPTGHAIPQALRDDFSVIEDKAMHWEGTRVFTQMRTATQAYFEEERLKPLNAPAEPKDLFFVEKVLAKLSRFNECAQDGQGADIGWHWFDILVRLSLLNRVRKSPALWELTAQGEIALAYARLAYWKPIINETIELSEEDKKAFLAAGFGIAVPIKYVSMAEMKARYPACDHKYVFFGESKRRQCKLCDELEPHACSLCGDTGKYQDGDSGTDEDGRAPNIVDCDCGAGLQ